MQDKAVILIVDDLDVNINILDSMLDKEYFIKRATDGPSALELAKQEPLPDLILLDIEMPQMDGYDVLEELNNFTDYIAPPVIFVTGNDTEKDEEKGLNLGAVDYIKKPLNQTIVNARVRTQLSLKKQKDELIYNASHDQLTGLYNRHHLSDEGTRKFSRAKRTGDDLSVILLDIDHFKLINDTYGHFTGDKVLKQVAYAIEHDKRVEDICARFGGEEFIIVLEGCNVEFAKVKAEKFRKDIEKLNPENIKITSSFGVCQYNVKHNSFEDILKDADIALYEAKDSGRNMVIDFKF